MSSFRTLRRSYLSTPASTVILSIGPSKLPAGAPILFIRKKDGSLQLCVNYQADYQEPVPVAFDLGPTLLVEVSIPTGKGSLTRVFIRLLSTFYPRLQ